MTPKQVYRATWVPHPAPAGEREEVMAPWTVDFPFPRILTAVRVEGEVYVLACSPDDESTVTECWKVIP